MSSLFPVSIKVCFCLLLFLTTTLNTKIKMERDDIEKSDSELCDDFRNAVLLIERRYQSTEQLFSRTHEKLLAELMAYKRELIGDVAASRYHSGLVSLLSKETQDRDRFAAIVERQARMIIKLQKKVALSEQRGRDAREKHEAEMEQLRLVHLREKELAAKRLLAAQCQDEIEVRRNVKIGCSKLRVSVQELRLRLEDLRSLVSPCSPNSVAVSASMSKVRSEDRPLTKQRSAILPSKMNVMASSSTTTITRLVVPPTWKSDLHDLIRTIKVGSIADASTQCSSPCYVIATQCPLVDASTETDTHEPAAASTRDDLVGGDDVATTVETAQQVDNLQQLLVTRVLAGVDDGARPSLEDPLNGEKEEMMNVTADASKCDDAVTIPPLQVQETRSGIAEVAADDFCQQRTMRRAMVHWLRRLRGRQQLRLGVFLKDRVAAVLGLKLRPDLVLAPMEKNTGIVPPRRPSSGRAVHRSHSQRHSCIVPLETFEAARSAQALSRNIDHSVCLMTTTSPRVRHVL